MGLKEHEGASTPTLPALLIEGAPDLAMSRITAHTLATPEVGSGVRGDVHATKETLAGPVLGTMTVGAIAFALLRAAEAKVRRAVTFPTALPTWVLLEVGHLYWAPTTGRKGKGVVRGKGGYPPTVGMVLCKSAVRVSTLEAIANPLDVEVGVKEHAHYSLRLFLQVCALLSERGPSFECVPETGDLGLYAGVVKASCSLVHHIGSGVIPCEVAQLLIP